MEKYNNEAFDKRSVPNFYYYRPRHRGESSYGVLAWSEEEALALVNNHVGKKFGESPTEDTRYSMGWETGAYTLRVYGATKVLEESVG